MGWLAIGELDGVPYLQLCENRPYELLDGAEIDRLIDRSDRVDQQAHVADGVADASAYFAARPATARTRRPRWAVPLGAAAAVLDLPQGHGTLADALALWVVHWRARWAAR